jgi:hypothetical protein
MSKDGHSPIEGLIPQGIAFMSVEDFPLLQVADFVAWGYSRLELMHARGIETLNAFQKKEFDLLTRASRQWRAFRPRPEGGAEVLTLDQAGV